MSQTPQQKQVSEYMHALEVARKTATRSKEAAIKYLEEAGIIEKGEGKKEAKSRK